MTPYTKQIVELHKIHKAIENCGCNKDNEQGGGDENTGNLLMSLIPTNYPKPDLFLVQGDTEDNYIDVTNYKIDDLVNLYEQVQSQLLIMCLYESSDLTDDIIGNISFGLKNGFYFEIKAVGGRYTTTELSYNNKVYYYYIKQNA